MAFQFSWRFSLKDQKLNRRSDHPHCAAWLMPVHACEVRPRRDHRGVNLISNALPFGRLWYGEPNAVSNAVDYAKFRSRSHDAVIRVYGEGGNVIETYEHARDLKKFHFFENFVPPIPEI